MSGAKASGRRASGNKHEQMSVTEDGEEVRRLWAVPKPKAIIEGIGRADLDWADPDDRNLKAFKALRGLPEYRERLRQDPQD